MNKKELRPPMNKDEREAFEKEYLRRGYIIYVNDDGEYIAQTKAGWDMWQAARSSLDAELVELLEECVAAIEWDGDPSPFGLAMNAENRKTERLKKAVSSAKRNLAKHKAGIKPNAAENEGR
jgi:hypothetical protein